MKISYLTLLIGIAGLSTTAYYQPTTKKLYGQCSRITKAPNDRYITVWVHGLRVFGRNTSGLGLHHSSFFTRRNSITRTVKAVAASYTDSYSAAHVFAFIWSAEFSLEGRQQAAQDLYEVLTQLAKEYHLGEKDTPKLRLIGFSEGVNVVLSLAKYKKANDFFVDELILLAGPVQDSTSCYSRDPLFHRVFNLYSSGDYIQVLSPQRVYDLECRNPIFTTRRFLDASNLIQVKVRTNGHAMGHFGFNSPKFVVMIDPIIEQLNYWLNQKQQCTDCYDPKYILTVYPCERMMLLRHQSKRHYGEPIDDSCCVQL